MKVKFKNKARNPIQLGVNSIADAVKITLGPKGLNVIIRDSENMPKVTKDGVTVAKAFYLEDELQNMGVKLLQGVAKNAEEDAGDGTTTATVLTQAILNNGMKLVEAGYNPLDIKDGIDIAVKMIVEELRLNSKEIDFNSDMIYNIAKVSSNNNDEIGKLVSDTFIKVGREGAVSVEDSPNNKTYSTVVQGMQFDRGMVSPYFSKAKDKMECSMSDPMVFISDQELTEVSDILPTLEAVIQAKRPLVVIAKDITGQALGTLVMNKLQGGAQVVAIKAPGFGEWQKELLEDIAITTGATVCTDVSEVDGGMLGMADSITVSQMNTIIVGGKGRKEEMSERVKYLKDLILDVDTTENMKDKYMDRVSKLTGGVGVIYVGSISEVEMKEKKDRIEDAKCAVSSAIQEGIVVGGGVALMRASMNILDSTDQNTDQSKGFNVLIESCLSPIKTIAENSGKNGDVIVDNCIRLNLGYNAKTDTYEDLFLSGIIDPLKVTRIALENAASVAGTILTTNCALI